VVKRVNSVGPHNEQNLIDDCDMIRYKRRVLMWAQKLSNQLNLAHAARKKYEKEETKTNKRQFSLSSVQVQD